MSPAPVAGPGRSAQDFFETLSFPPDPFQRRACAALEAGRSVLVSAPTGSGKTLVAEYGVVRALAAGGRAFYTTPLKALSNQKLGDLSAAHGPDQVGLLTGDTSLRAGAPVVVMTTEVLRNMLLTGSEALADLHTVVLDEVHYLQDPYRGGVWEEVLLLTPPHVTFVCLSATVSNADELAAWLRSVRGPTELVVERHRPVQLSHHVALRKRGERWPTMIDLLRDGRLGPEAAAIDASVQRAMRNGSGPALRRGSPGRGRMHRHIELPVRPPKRTEVLDLLDDADLLPAIVFIFSRAACDDAVRQCLDDGIRMTDAAARRSIREVAERHVEEISDRELRTLGYDHWLSGLEAGVGAHHAGLVPAFREAVEECFATGLLQAVFATETLSLGINMPARSVVIERFSKYGAAGRAPLTAGEYAQLTGRAGRRGLDHQGHAVVCVGPEPPLARIAAVAVADPPDLRSSFRPTYNLAVNLVRRVDRATALDLLRRSFAQWQADRSPQPERRDRLADRLARRLAVLEELGYVDDWRLTAAGMRLTRTYHECDLLVAEILAGEVVDGITPALLAGVLSCVVFEQRRSRAARPGNPRTVRAGRPHPAGRGGAAPAAARRRSLAAGAARELEERAGLISSTAERLRAVESIHRVPPTRLPDASIARAIAVWARGGELDDALDAVPPTAGTLAPGDFVRIVRQVADLAGQAGTVAPDPAVAAAARAVLPMLVRDVAASGSAASMVAPSRPTTVAPTAADTEVGGRSTTPPDSAP